MSVDLTRFDFHVHRFLNSPDVEAMTATEVGQYVLLLCKSWANGDDCRLPNDTKYLSKIARATKRSPLSGLVLSKFEIVWVEIGQQTEPERVTPDGKRETSKLRNKVLFEGWLEAKKRSEVAEAKARKRWELEHPNESHGSAVALPGQSTGNAQSKPTQTIHPSNQPSQPGGQDGQTDSQQTVGEVMDEVTSTVAQEPIVLGAAVSTIPKGQPGHYHRGQYPGTSPKAVFSHLSAAWIRAKGMSAVARYPKKYPESWQQLCDHRSADIIIPAFELWCLDEGKYSNTQFPSTEFCRFAQKYMDMVLPLNTAVRPPSRTEDQIASDTAAFQPIADANMKAVIERKTQTADAQARLAKDIEEGSF